MNHPFRTYLANYIDIGERDWQLIFSKLNFQKVKRKTVLLRQGEVCKQIYFVEKGLLHFYFIQNGTLITRYFTEAPMGKHDVYP